MADELMTMPDAAALLGVHRATVNRMIARGELEAVKLPQAYRREGKRLYLRRRDVERMATEKRAGGA
jgi:excisionase family DNA binding protein